MKLEGGAEIAAQVRALTTAGIPVCGHVGLTPQSATALGGYKVQARTAEAARKLLDDALALEAAGAFMIVVECVPAPVGGLVAGKVNMPIISIQGTIPDAYLYHYSEKKAAYAADFTGDAFGCLLDDGVQLRADMLFLGRRQIGRASCRERV